MEETVNKNSITNRSKENSIISDKSNLTDKYFSDTNKDFNVNKNELILPNIKNSNDNKDLKRQRLNEKFKSTNKFVSKYIVSKRHHNGCFHSDNRIKIENFTNKNYFGPVTLGIDEKTFDLIISKESLPSYNNESKYISVIDNNYNLNHIKKENPFQSTINRALVTKDESKCFSFKAKNYYEKAYNLSLQPKDIKYDNNNPIFLHLANPHEYRFFNVD